MKTKFYFLAALASIALASCTSDDFVGDNGPNVAQETSVTDGIAFGGGFKAITRADHVGADAAALLNMKFYVVAFNSDGAATPTWSQTFDNYLVEWQANTAGTTESNTSDWEYVSKTAPDWSGIAGNTQTIKYWDYSKSQYDFIAWSPGTASVVLPTVSTIPAGSVKITKPAQDSPYAPTYSLQGARLDLAKCYIADMVTAYKADMTPVQPKYQEEVQFTFRNLACKVRMALYETIPGYSVKDVKFYTDATTSIATGATATDAYLFTSGTTNADKFYTAGTYTVSFPTKGSSNISASDYNKAHVAFAADASGSATTEDFGALVLKGKEGNEQDTKQYLGRSLPKASYANPDNAGEPYYKIMLPNETGTVLQLRVDYTLVPTDGAAEEIKIHGATAYVPQIYATWKPNYAYTYIFKISDNTNGWTSTVNTDPAGLFPITFDAIVVDSEEHTQSTITTVATPSITTYQKGHDVSKDEYDATEGDIYIQVMNGASLATNLNNSGVSMLYSLSSGTWTEADVMEALNVVAETGSGTITGRNGLTLTDVSTATSFANNITTIPGADGNNINVATGTAAKFTPTASTNYAYVYDTGTYGGQAYTAEPADWPSRYYTDAACTTLASGTFSANTYYQKESTIRSYNEFTSAPSDWKTDNTNEYYRDEACTDKITGTYANPSASYTTQPADFPTGYYTDSSCSTAATAFTAGNTYYQKLKCYRKYTVNNKIYGVKVIKVE